LTEQDSIDRAAPAAFRTLQAKARAEHGGNTQPLLVVYAVESFLRRLSASEHANQMVLRGGMLMAANSIRRMTKDAVTTLRGARIRETAVRVLAGNNQPDAPVHYRDWFELLTAQGFMPTGKDPLATFLTQVGRSPLVQRTTTAGMYVLDLEFPQRARTQLAQLAAAQAETQELPPHATVEEIAAAGTPGDAERADAGDRAPA
jgi:hypothetical protein